MSPQALFPAHSPSNSIHTFLYWLSECSISVARPLSGLPQSGGVMQAHPQAPTNTKSLLLVAVRSTLVVVYFG